MARRPFADIPGHKKFDAGLCDLASLAKRLAAEAAQKSEKAGSDDARAAFDKMRETLERLAAEARAARGQLWEGQV